jgi:hypothetical protein
MDTLLSSFSLYSLFLQTHLQTHHNRNNLKVQDRQNRVCTTIAIAIVAETCSPFTVLPALMNEYRVPDLNVQNGVLKALSFLFEYIGPMGELLVVVGCCWLLLVVVGCCYYFFFFSDFFYPTRTLHIHSQRLHLCNYSINHKCIS